LYLHWIKNTEENEGARPNNAIAVFTPSSHVPDFKFKNNSGRSNLKTNVDKISNFYDGWGLFIKDAFAYNGAREFTVLEPIQGSKGKPVQICLLDKERQVTRLTAEEGNNYWSGDANEIECIAIVHELNPGFDVQSMEPNLFMTKAKTEGGCGIDINQSTPRGGTPRATAGTVTQSVGANSQFGPSSKASQMSQSPGDARFGSNSVNAYKAQMTMAEITHTDNISTMRLEAPEGHEVAVPGKGCYLRYSPDSMGKLYLHWSEKPIATAGVLAYFEPGKIVPGFKYRTNGGRADVVKGADDKRNLFQGWVQFLKEAISGYYAYRIMVFETGDEAAEDPNTKAKIVWCRKETNEIFSVMPGECLYLDPSEVQSIGVLNVHDNTFNVHQMPANQFVPKCKTIGSAIDLGASVNWPKKEREKFFQGIFIRGMPDRFKSMNNADLPNAIALSSGNSARSAGQSGGANSGNAFFDKNFVSSTTEDDESEAAKKLFTINKGDGSESASTNLPRPGSKGKGKGIAPSLPPTLSAKPSLMSNKSNDSVFKTSQKSNIATSGGFDDNGLSLGASDPGQGCYLVYKSENNGKLITQWAKFKPEGAVFFAQPGKPVPGFKFTANEGRVDLMSGVNGSFNREKLFSSFCTWLKEMVINWKAEFIQVLDAVEHVAPLQLVFHKKDDKVIRADASVPNQKLPTADVSILAACPRDAMHFNGMTQCHETQFQMAASAAGGQSIGCGGA